MLSKADFEKLSQEDMYNILASSHLPEIRELAQDYAMACGLSEHIDDPKYDEPLVSSDTVSVLLRLSGLIDEEGKFVRGANKAICEALFGHTKTGGSFNDKIQQVKADITRLVAIITTTVEKQPELAEIAA